MFQATVEDLDLLPALTIHPTTPLVQALELSYEHEYSYLPVVSTKSKRLLGYLTAEQLRKATSSATDETVLVRDHYIRFAKPDGQREFQKITPSTPLEDLERFFANGEEFAVVTDIDRRFVLGVAVKEDLEKFVKNRPSLKV
jgi:CBS domain-containing protein